MVSKNADVNAIEASPDEGALSGISGMQFDNQECISTALNVPFIFSVLYGLHK